MDYSTCCEIFGISDITFLPIAAMEIVKAPDERRSKVYRQLLEANKFDVSFDWFQEVYESELSEGKRKGQHFTPEGVHILLSELVENNLPQKHIHEPTAGTGSLVIGHWWNYVKKRLPWEIFPSQMNYCVWELSDRAIPLLLINLSIRGINATVYHGDVLEQSIKSKYLVINRTNDSLGFSDIVLTEPVL